MIDAIGTDWKTNLKTGGQTDRDERLYIDFRGMDYPDVSRDTRNYIDRGDCESTDLPGARGEIGSYDGTSAARDSTVSHSGDYSIKHVTDGAATRYVFFDDNGNNTTDMHGYLPGETVEAIVWMYVPSTGGPSTISECALRIGYYADAAWTNVVAEPTTYDTWEKLTARIVIADNATGFRAQTYINSAASATEYIYIDDISVHRYPTFELAREDNLINRGNCEDASNGPSVMATTGLADMVDGSSTLYSRSGDRSWYITKSAAGTDYIYFTESATVDTTITANETFYFEMWLYIPTGSVHTIGNCYMLVREVDETATNRDTTYAVDSTYAPDAGYDKWFKVSFEHTTRDDLQTCGLLYRTPDSAADPGDLQYIDDVRLTRHSVPGTHKLTGGYTEHLVTLPDTGTLQVKFKPNFAYDVASSQYLASWYVSATKRLILYYLAVNDKFYVYWQDGGTGRSIFSAQYDDGTTYRNINQWITLTFAFDLTTGDTTGSSLWIDKTQDSTAWNGAIDAKSTVFNKMQIRAYNGTVGDYDIAYIRMFPDYVATDADVQNDFKDVLAEEIYWSFDGHATGKTRCHIPANDYVAGISFEKGVANRQSGSHSSNTFSAALKNLNGEFSDDQYAAFDPSNAVYNGLVTQKYLQRRCRVTVEDWYDGDFDTVFTGRLTSAGFSRTTQHNNISYVTISARDNVERFHTARFPYGRHWEDVQFSDTVESNSLIHLLARQARPRVKQYLAHNSFEDATFTDAWASSSVTSWSRVADPLFNTYGGEVVNATGTDGFIYQDVTFAGTEKLSVGQSFTFYVWAKSAGAVSDSDAVRLQEYDGAAYNSSQSTVALSLSGGEGWILHAVTHTITESDTDGLRVRVIINDGDTVQFDGAMLINGDRALNYFRESSYVLNQAASGGAVSADYADRTAYDVFGFDCDTVDITHPWKRIEENESPWTHLKMLADSTAVLYIGDDSSGTLRFRAVLADDYSDLVPFYEFDSLGAAPLSTNLTMAQANRIVGRGVKIVKDRFTRFLWSAEASRGFDTDELGYLDETIANGDTWPDPDEYGPFFARYDGQPPKIKKEEKQQVDPEPVDSNFFFDQVIDWTRRKLEEAYPNWPNRGKT